MKGAIFETLFILKMLQTTIYYFLLYVIVIVVNYFKLKKEFKVQDDTTPTQKFNWRKVFFVSNEIIYTAAGVYIILLDEKKDWTPSILAVLMLLILVSTSIGSMSERFAEKAQFRLHLTIIFIIMIGTFFTLSNEKHFGSNAEAINDTLLQDSFQKYRIAIPYIDKSLIKQFGYDNFSDKRLFYYSEATAKNEKEAIDKGILKFWQDTLIQPVIMKGKTMSKESLLKIDNEIILAVKVK
jgi:hypothetical protein